MVHRLALASAIALLAAAPALAQELEVGGGWFQPNPLGGGWEGPKGPSLDLAFTEWRGRIGVTLGGTAVFGREGIGLTAHPHVYTSVALRHRWMNADGRGFLHAGAGVGPLFWRRTPARRPETQITLLWHVEVMATRTLRPGLHLRAGISAMPWPARLLAAQATAKLAWTF